MKTKPLILFVSLQSDEAKREALAANFPAHFPQMRWIEAVDGRELDAGTYCKYVLPSLEAGHRLILPGEVGCTLSHLRALKEFLDSDSERALILEDDINGDDSDLVKVIERTQQQPEHSLLIHGGQEGMPARKYIFGKPTDIPQVYRLPTYSNQYIFRTCCYSVSRTSARQILKAHETRLQLADAWSSFFSGTDCSILFSRQLQHPKELTGSGLEDDRARLSRKSMQKRSLLPFLIHRYSRLKRKLGALICLLGGYRPIAR